MPNDAAIEIRWAGFEPDDADAGRAVALLKQEGGDATIQAPPEPGIVFIPIIVGAIALVGLAKAIKSFLDDCGRGVMIDVRAKPVRITKEKNLSRGVVVIVDTDGKVSIEQPDHESIADLIKGAMAGK